MTAPLISIIIPTYNRAAELVTALDSIEAQSETNYEVLIVDNHSEDGTDEMILARRDPRMHLIKVHNDGVIARSRNIGLAAAHGKYLAFLDSDDWWTPDKLMRCLKVLEAGADVTYHDLRISPGPAHPPGKVLRTWPLRGDPFHALLRGGNALANSSVMVRRAVLGQMTQAEDPSLVGMEDFDLWLRLAKAGARLQRCDGVLGFYRMGDTNFTNPGRSLQALNALMRRHCDIRFESTGWWLPYGIGRAHYQLGDKSAARRALRRILRRKAPLSIYAKTALMLLR